MAIRAYCVQTIDMGEHGLRRHILKTIIIQFMLKIKFWWRKSKIGLLVFGTYFVLILWSTANLQAGIRTLRTTLVGLFKSLFATFALRKVEMQQVEKLNNPACLTFSTALITLNSI